MVGMRTRNMSFLVLILELIAAAIRLVFAIDPLSARFIPQPILEPFLTASFPISLSSMILLSFFWAELLSVDARTISGLLTTKKIPAVIIVLVIVGLEVASSALRASGNSRGSPLITINLCV